MKTLITKLSLPALFMLFISACAEREVILPGERISVVDNAETWQVNAEAAEEGVVLPEEITNIRFTQPGLRSGHSGGHLSLAGSLGLAWSMSSGLAVEDGTEMAQAVAGGDIIYTITPDAILNAFDLEDGVRRWSLEVEEKRDQTQPSVSGGLGLNNDRLYVHSGGKSLVAVVADTGEVIWRRDDFSLPLVGGPTVTDDFVAVTDIDGRLFMLNAAEGAEVWSRVGSSESTGVVGAPFPAMRGGEVILGGVDGEVSALRAPSGEFLWASNLALRTPRTALDGISAIIAHPVHDGGLVVAVTMSGQMAAFNTSSGHQIWTKAIASISMPWIAGNTIFVVSTRGRVFALRRSDGEIRWITELPDAIPVNVSVSKNPPRYVGPVVASDKVIIAGDGVIYRLDAATGAIENSFSVGGSITTTPIIVNNTLVVLDRQGRLTAYR